LLEAPLHRLDPAEAFAAMRSAVADLRAQRCDSLAERQLLMPVVLRLLLHARLDDRARENPRTWVDVMNGVVSEAAAMTRDAA
jgi:hypothetical protein